MNLRAALVNKKNRVKGCFYDFCKQTILHGWHYLVNDKEESSKADEGAKEDEKKALEHTRRHEMLPYFLKLFKIIV